MNTQWVCEHNPEDPNHLICESKDPRRHWWINVFIIGGVVWFVFLSGLVMWIILSRGEDEDSLQTLPDPRLGIRAVQSPLDYSVPTVPPSSSAGSNSFLIEDSTGRPAGFLGEDPAGSATQLGGEEKSLDYSGQTEPYLEAEALYFSKEGEQVGRGLWPPKAGEETKLKVYWNIAGDPISIATEIGSPNIVVTGKLSENVEWTGFAPMGAGLTYESATRTVRFIPREGNTAVFEVAITPIAQQLDEKLLIIIDSLKMILAGREILSPNILIQW